MSALPLLDTLLAKADEFNDELCIAMARELETDPRRPAGIAPHSVSTGFDLIKIVGQTPEWLAFGDLRAKEYHARLWAAGSPMDTWQKAAYADAKDALAQGKTLTARQCNVIADVEAGEEPVASARF